MSLNRTRVELKQILLVEGEGAREGLNRTRVELKLLLNLHLEDGVKVLIEPEWN